MIWMDEIGEVKNYKTMYGAESVFLDN